MADAGTRSDALRVIIDEVEVEGPHIVGTIPGVAPLAAAGFGVPGTGRLRSIGDGTLLQWRAPGSDTWGPAVQVESDGEVLLEDGVSADRWLRVHVAAAFLGPPAEAEVRLSDWFNNGLAGPNVTAEQAENGYVRAFNIRLRNEHRSTDVMSVVVSVAFSGLLRIWPDSGKVGLGLGVAFERIAAGGGEATLYGEMTVGPGAPPHPGLLHQLDLNWYGA